MNSNQAEQQNNPMSVNIKDILKHYQDQLTELNFQAFVKDEQIKNLQAEIKELQDKLKELKPAKKIDAKK